MTSLHVRPALHATTCSSAGRFLVDKQVQDGTIHFLSIDVEGNDYDVYSLLMGGSNALKRVECLEFECHVVPPLDQHPLWMGLTLHATGQAKTSCGA
mgnify:CR=1 FL=1